MFILQIDASKIIGTETNKNISRPTENLDSALLKLMSGTKESNMVDPSSEPEMDPDIHLNAASDLTETKAKTVPELIEDLKNSDPIVRSLALDALYFLGEQAKEAVPAIIEVLKKDSVPYLRMQAAAALGMIGDKAAIPALIEALKDYAGRTSEAALWALKKLGYTGPEVQ